MPSLYDSEHAKARMIELFDMVDRLGQFDRPFPPQLVERAIEEAECAAFIAGEGGRTTDAYVMAQAVIAAGKASLAWYHTRSWGPDVSPVQRLELLVQILDGQVQKGYRPVLPGSMLWGDFWRLVEAARTQPLPEERQEFTAPNRRALVDQAARLWFAFNGGKEDAAAPQAA